MACPTVTSGRVPQVLSCGVANLHGCESDSTWESVKPWPISIVVVWFGFFSPSFLLHCVPQECAGTCVVNWKEGKCCFLLMGKHEEWRLQQPTSFNSLKIFDRRMLYYYLSINRYFSVSSVEFSLDGSNLWDVITILMIFSLKPQRFVVYCCWLHCNWMRSKSLFKLQMWFSEYFLGTVLLEKLGLSGRWAVCMKLQWYWVFQVAGSNERCFPWAAEMTKQNSAARVGPAHSCVSSPLSVH